METIYPFVRSIRNPSAISAGTWQAGKPLGVTIHYTAQRAMDPLLKFMVPNKIGYHILIDRQGFVHQCAYFDQRVNHAGKAVWAGLSPNRNHLAVGLLSWGALAQQPDGLYTWTGVKLPRNECVERPAANGVLAWWDAATLEQEASLLRFLWWAMAAGIDPSHVCGHDECALPFGRKSDPGGVVSFTMPELRERLRLTR